MRATFNKDISTGLIPVTSEFSTEGPKTTFHIKNSIPEKPDPVCYILKPGTCTDDQYEQVLNNTVRVKDWIVVEYDVFDADKAVEVGEQEDGGRSGVWLRPQEEAFQRVLGPGLRL